MEKRKVKLICEKCLSRNYVYPKNKNSIKKLEVKKYCAKCAAHTLHKETR